MSLANHHSLWSKASSDSSSSSSNGQCIWYGTCEGCIPGHSDYNIAYNGPAKPLTDESDIETLKGVCPELFHHLGKEFYLIMDGFRNRLIIDLCCV